MTNSTRGFNKDLVSAAAAEQVLGLLDRMQPGDEFRHLEYLYNIWDLRGSDVRLDTGSFVDNCRQILPYPAIAWEWQCVQSYAWATPQHINVLELIAYFNYLRYYTGKREARAARFFHVLDSRVASCVVAKGR